MGALIPTRISKNQDTKDKMYRGPWKMGAHGEQNRKESLFIVCTACAQDCSLQMVKSVALVFWKVFFSSLDLKSERQQNKMGAGLAYRKQNTGLGKWMWFGNQKWAKKMLYGQESQNQGIRIAGTRGATFKIYYLDLLSEMQDKAKNHPIKWSVEAQNSSQCRQENAGEIPARNWQGT